MFSENYIYRYFTDPKDCRLQAHLTVDLIFSRSFLEQGNNRVEAEEKFYQMLVEQPPHRGTYPAQFNAVRQHELTGLFYFSSSFTKILLSL
jgi:hypothetical protein